MLPINHLQHMIKKANITSLHNKNRGRLSAS